MDSDAQAPETPIDAARCGRVTTMKQTSAAIDAREVSGRM